MRLVRKVYKLPVAGHSLALIFLAMDHPLTETPLVTTIDDILPME